MDRYKNNFVQQAIVLHVYTDDVHKVRLLDAHHGNIICYVPKRELFIGAVIEYQLIKKRRYYMAYEVHIVHVPFAIAKQDILFVHHVLELCFYFLTEEQEAQSVFALVHYLCTHGDQITDQLLKKIYLSKLFILFGIYPEKPYIEHDYWQQLLGASIDTIVISCKDVAIEPALTVWLRSCMQTHPLYNAFKTAHCIDQKE